LKEVVKTDDAETKEWLKMYLKTGNTKYWGFIFEKYKKQIYIRNLKMLTNNKEAEDVTSETFIKAFENSQNFDLKRLFFPWLSQIATNLCIDKIRRKKVIQFLPFEEQINTNDPDTSENEAERKELRSQIIKAINKLKSPQKRCFCFFYIHQKSYQEIVGLTGFSYNEVRSHIQNGKRKFKQFMSGYLI
jgi:RNA polymerase sigma-70 factor (ECF subfamily)